MSGLELLLEHLSEQKKAYDMLEVYGFSFESKDDNNTFFLFFIFCVLAILAPPLQSMIIEKLMENK